MSKRKIILEDQEFIHNPERKECFACYLGLDHEKLEDFVDDLKTGEQGLVKTGERGFSKNSDLTEYLYDNYSKLELAMIVQMHMEGKMGVSERITINSKEEMAQHNFQQAINSILKL